MTKQVAVVMNISDEAYEILNRLCEAWGCSQVEYIRHNTLDIMRSHMDLYFPEHAKHDEWEKLLEKEAREE